MGVFVDGWCGTAEAVCAVIGIVEVNNVSTLAMVARHFSEATGRRDIDISSSAKLIRSRVARG
jgi:hypothetical protein